KQACHNKAGRGMGRGIQPEEWMNRYQFNGANVQDYPLPSLFPTEHGQALDRLAGRLAAQEPTAACANQTPTPALLAEARSKSDDIRALMVAEQEELDWEVYRLSGLLDEDLAHDGALPGVLLGERA